MGSGEPAVEAGVLVVDPALAPVPAGAAGASPAPEGLAGTLLAARAGLAADSLGLALCTVAGRRCGCWTAAPCAPEALAVGLLAAAAGDVAGELELVVPVEVLPQPAITSARPVPPIASRSERPALRFVVGLLLPRTFITCSFRLTLLRSGGPAEEPTATWTKNVPAHSQTSSRREPS